MELLERHFDTAFDAPDGIKKLRELILTLAMQGKLVRQDRKDQPASELLKEIEAEKKRLVTEGKIKEPKLLSPIVPGEVPYEVPMGWEWVRLGTFLEMVNGRAFKPTEWKSTGLPIVRIQNLNNPNAPFNYCEESDVKEQHIIQEKDFLISWSGTPGTSFGAFVWSGGKAALNQHIFRCNQIGKPFTDEFLRRAINNRLDFLISLAQGAVGLKHVTKGTLEDMPLPLPPCTEQSRIVAKIDELMARCDALEKLRAERDSKRLAVHVSAVRQLLNVADTNGHIQAREFLGLHFGDLYSSKENVAQLRKAFLFLAISGILTTVENTDSSVSITLGKLIAEQSHNSSLQQRERETVISELQNAVNNISGNRVTLKARDFCSFITKGTTPAAEELRGIGDIPFLKVYNIVENSIDFDYKPSFISLEVHRNRLRRSVLYPGDVIMNIVGPPLGKVAVVTSQFKEWNMNQALAVFRPLAGINNRYIYYALSAEHVLESVLRDVKGTAGQDNLSLDQCRNLDIPIPSIEEQDRIVSIIDRLRGLCDTLEQQIEAAGATQSAMLNAMMAQYGGQQCA